MGKIIGEGLTFDDVLIVPKKSNFLIEEISTKTRITKSMALNAPIVSAPLDTVTESAMAIAIARQGGIGFIHNSMSIEDQGTEVDKVKRSEHGVITDPFSLSPNHYVYEANDLMGKFHISGVPITENGFLVGIITNRDLKFEEDHSKKIYEVMTRDNLITAPVGTSLSEAKTILTAKKIEKLPLIDEEGMLKGLITIKDIDKVIKYPNSAKDSLNRLICGAKVSITPDMYERIEELIKQNVDIICLNQKSGNNDRLLSTIKSIKSKYNIQLLAGSVATESDALNLIDAGCDGLIAGFGSGSISTSRVISGVGIPQITSIMNVYNAAVKHNIPVVSDGGVKYSGDITKALAAGASSVMIGGIFAGCDESPGNIELYQGRKYKIYRGVMPIPKISTSEPKMFTQKKEIKEVPECVEGRVFYKGSAKDIVQGLLNGLKSGMNYSGSKDIHTLQEDSQFMKITDQGHKESHPHSISITKEATNYSINI
ncbi:MAG: IMP dehydrogenase [Lachnospirales bacterium]